MRMFLRPLDKMLRLLAFNDCVLYLSINTSMIEVDRNMLLLLLCSHENIISTMVLFLPTIVNKETMYNFCHSFIR